MDLHWYLNVWNVDQIILSMEVFVYYEIFHNQYQIVNKLIQNKTHVYNVN